MSTTVHLDVGGIEYKLTAHRSKCRCGSCPTEEISVVENDVDPLLDFSYNVKSDYGLVGIDLTDHEDVERLMSVIHHLTVSLGKSLAFIQDLPPEVAGDVSKQIGATLIQPEAGL